MKSSHILMLPVVCSGIGSEPQSGSHNLCRAAFHNTLPGIEMVVSEQVDAMRLEGTDVVKKLVTPRLQAILLSLPILTLISDAMALGGGFFVVVFSLTSLLLIRKSVPIRS